MTRRSRIQARTFDVAGGPRWLERGQGEIEVFAPEGWSNARVEAWLDWADTLPRDLPLEIEPLPADETAQAWLAGGPDAYAARLATWGLALGHFTARDEAHAFRAELVRALLRGEAAPGPRLAFGARLHPLALDPSSAPPSRTTASPISPPSSHLHSRLRAVSQAVLRCEGDAAACADPRANQALARAGHAAREAGASDADLADAIALGVAGLDAAPLFDAACVLAGPDETATAAAVWSRETLEIARHSAAVEARWRSR
ncbi:MAG: hypothetical protein KGL69_05310, partial [Alphaproteobacteria bacterium]|nr:hypothetical protein [Alphaproteobacteria bacterium]